MSDKHARRLLRAMSVEQRYIVPTVLQPAFCHTDHNPVMHQELVPKDGVCAVRAHEELMVEREITEFELQSTNTVVV